MKKAFFILIVSSLVFFVQDKLETKTGFDYLCSDLGKLMEFKENGIRLEFSTNNSTKLEFKKILSIVNAKYKNSKIQLSTNEMKIITKDMKIDVNIYNNNRKTDVEIDMINYDIRKNIAKLKKEITELQTENCYEVKYFKYIKGKINSEQQINEYINSKELQNLDIISIHNGYVGTANLYNGERLNIAKTSYNTGSYLVIGSPIIITTY